MGLFVNLELPQRSKMLAKNISITQSPNVCLIFINIRKLLGWESVGPKLQDFGTTL